MKFALTLLCLAFGAIVIQAAATPSTQIQCHTGFFLCVQVPAYCGGKQAIVVCNRAGNGFDLVSCCANGCKNVGLPQCL
ncbi:hypothetical protein VF21_01076 [Pseudogymnoascus sp. 05NY08]|nr:hypothetical protein VF21_01076 [Pseudogymnoascus sp. 05NY08]